MSHPLEECSFLLLLGSMVLQPGTVEGESGGRGEGQGKKKGKERERKKGGGEERIFCAKQPEWVRVPTSFWTQANDTYSKHHLSIFVFLNWKANSNISSVGCGRREKVGKEAATEISFPGISQTWSASSIRESSMPL